jgi:hypothetical protein
VLIVCSVLFVVENRERFCLGQGEEVTLESVLWLSQLHPCLATYF